MTSHHTWHLDEDLLRGYVGGTVDGAHASSVEQHVLRCVACRTRVNALVTVSGTSMLDDVWIRVADDLQSPRPPVTERVLTRIGLAADDALLLWSAPAFKAPWLAATVATLAFATLAASINDQRGLMFFLIVAPLLPVAGVALAYGPMADPAFEVAAATPYSALRLVLLRTVAVLATTLPLAVAAGLLLPWTGLGVAWLAPSLACVAATLAASTWVTVSRAAVCVGVLWTTVVALASGPGFLSPEVAVDLATLPIYALLTLAALAVVWMRGGHLNHLGEPS